MSGKYALLLREHREVITHIWADEVFAGERTGHTARLSYSQLIDHLPNLFDELGEMLDRLATSTDIAASARRVRYFIHVRFQQGCLIDEVARELSLLRAVINEFLWRETFALAERESRELRWSLRNANTFFDELTRQMIVVYAASLRPPVPTHASIWHPSGRPRRRVTDTP